MTILVSKQLVDDFLRFKAPSGFMYLVKAISFSTVQTDNFYVYVVGRNIEDDITDTKVPTDPIAIYTPTIAGTNYLVTDIDEKTKFLTFGKNSASGVNVFIIVYGELVKASVTELILEWFRKGR